VQRLWTVVTQSLSRMGLRQVIVAVAQNVVSLHASTINRNAKESSLPVSFTGSTGSLDPLSFNVLERMDVQEFHSPVSCVGKLLIEIEFRGWHT